MEEQVNQLNYNNFKYEELNQEEIKQICNFWNNHPGNLGHPTFSEEIEPFAIIENCSWLKSPEIEKILVCLNNRFKNFCFDFEKGILRLNKIKTKITEELIAKSYKYLTDLGTKEDAETIIGNLISNKLSQIFPV